MSLVLTERGCTDSRGTCLLVRNVPLGSDRFSVATGRSGLEDQEATGDFT